MIPQSDIQGHPEHSQPVSSLDLDVRHTRYFSNGKDRTNVRNKKFNFRYLLTKFYVILFIVNKRGGVNVLWILA